MVSLVPTAVSVILSAGRLFVGIKEARSYFPYNCSFAALCNPQTRCGRGVCASLLGEGAVLSPSRTCPRGDGPPGCRGVGLSALMGGMNMAVHPLPPSSPAPQSSPGAESSHPPLFRMSSQKSNQSLLLCPWLLSELCLRLACV